VSDSHVRESGSSGNNRGAINVRKVVFYGLVSMVVVIVILIFGAGCFTQDNEEPVQVLLPEPQPITLEELRAREDEELNSYKLLDSISGVYSIPIRRAMELVSDEAYMERSATEGKR